MTRPLAGKVALVAGATRGAGRGIAVALGEAGATVYCTGRSVIRHPATPGRPETIDETAAKVTAAGGKGIAVRCDHTVEAEVAALADRIRSEHGSLDILVNDVWGGDAVIEWGKPFWKIPYESVRTLVERAVLSHVLTAQKCAPLFREGSLIVEVTDGDSMQYRGHLLYDLVKTTVIRLAFAWHEELATRRVASIAVTPGFLRSEAMLALFGVAESNWRDHVAKDADWAESETPLYVGRAVAAVAADPLRAQKSGRVFASWTLAREYGFTDADGRRPDWGRHFATRYGEGVQKRADEGMYAYWTGYGEMMRAVEERKAKD